MTRSQRRCMNRAYLKPVITGSLFSPIFHKLNPKHTNMHAHTWQNEKQYMCYPDCPQGHLSVRCFPADGDCGWNKAAVSGCTSVPAQPQEQEAFRTHTQTHRKTINWHRRYKSQHSNSLLYYINAWNGHWLTCWLVVYMYWIFVDKSQKNASSNCWSVQQVGDDVKFYKAGKERKQPNDSKSNSWAQGRVCWPKVELKKKDSDAVLSITEWSSFCLHEVHVISSVFLS